MQHPAAQVTTEAPRAPASSGGTPALALAAVQPFAERVRVLGHPIRLLILDRLQSGGAMPVHRLITALDVTALSQGALSQHLARMRQAGLLAAQRHGHEVWYAVTDPHALTILNCIQAKLRRTPTSA
jgi:ArsR family transcriptional regulator